MSPIVTAERLSKTFRVKVRDPGLKGALAALVRPRYRDVHAVRDVTFRIEPGEIVAFLGPNGAGKTTTLKMLTGLLYPTAGRVEVAGFVPWTGGSGFKRRIALVLGNRQQLVWDLPPEETFLLNRAIYDIPEPAYRERLAELVELLELRDVLEKPVRQLSLGERMKRIELVLGPPPDGVTAATLATFGTVKTFHFPNAVLEVRREEAAATSARLLAALPVADLSIEDPPIEDVIRQAFAQGLGEDA